MEQLPQRTQIFSGALYFLTSGKRALIFITLALFIFTGCSSFPGNDPFLKNFPPVGANFEQHVQRMQQYLLDTRMPQRSASDVDLNLPFELKANPEASYKGKYLLIHGLNDSPGIWQDIASSLSENGYDVRAILLPGHGNTPEALLNVSYRHWLALAQEHFTLWFEPNKPFYIGGFSLGAVIATILVQENDGIDGLFLVSPAYYSTRNHLLRWASLVAPFKPWVFGGMIREDNPIRYNSIPINSAAQYYKTTRYLLRPWKTLKIDIPVLMVATTADSVVDVEKTRDFFQHKFTHPKKRLLLFDTDNTIARDGEIVIESSYPEKRILNQSHRSLLVAPQNPLFGEDGSILVCNGNEWPVFSSCLFYQGSDRWLAAEGTPSPDGIPVARTTYNPDYAALMDFHTQVFE